MERDFEMKFLVDSTAGKLCRWLRILGHDARYEPDAGPGEMVSAARREGRILLSRNRLLWTRDRSVVTPVRADVLEDQLRDLERVHPILRDARPFTRCLECNGMLEPVSREQVRNRVPEYVYQTQRAFGRCETCERVFWKATHWEAMRGRLERIFESRIPGDRS